MDRVVPCPPDSTIIRSSPFTSSRSLLAVACKDLVTILQIEPTGVSHIVDLHIGIRTLALEWSPAASDQDDAIRLALYIAGSDHRIRFYDDKDLVQTLEGHKDYINDMALTSTDGGSILASVSDDCTCITWDLNSPELGKRIYRLSSPVIAVKWRQKELVVAERAGKVTTYDHSTGTALRSFCLPTPLLSISWSTTSDRCIGLTPDGWLILDKDGATVSNGRGQATGQQIVSYGPADHFALCGKFEVEICNPNGQVISSIPQDARVVSMSWNAPLQYLAFLCNAKLRFVDVPLHNEMMH